MEFNGELSHTSIVDPIDRRNSGDTNSSAVSGIPLLSTLVPGSRLEARDGQGSEKWFSVKVQDIDSEEGEVLVHYHNWNSRHDEWIPIGGERLRVPTRTSSRHDSEPTSNQCDDGKDLGPGGLVGGESALALSTKSPTMKEFKSGEKVMAVWKLNRKYPAKIVRFEPDGTYLVEFCEDGVECKVKPNNIRRMRKDEEDQYESDTNTNGLDSSYPDSLNHAEEEIETARSSRRRDRKMKFDLKSVLNIRTTPPPTPPPPQIRGDKSSKSSKSRTDSKQNSIDVNTTVEINNKGKIAANKDEDSQVTPSKKQLSHANKRTEESQKKGNKAKNNTHLAESSNKTKSDSNCEKLAKNKKKPVTNGKSDLTKKASSKILTNNNSSKSGIEKNDGKDRRNDGSKHVGHSSKSVEVVQTVTGKRERKRKKFWDEEEFAAASQQQKVSKKKPLDGVKKEVKHTGVDVLGSVDKNKSKKSSEVASVDQQISRPKNSEAQTKAVDLLERGKKSKISNLISDGTKLGSSKTVKKDELNTRKTGNSHEVFCGDNQILTSGKSQKPENGKVLLYRTSFDMTEDPSKIALKMKEGVNIPGPGVSIPVDSSRLPKGWEKRVIQRGIGVTKGKWDVFIVEEEGRKSFRSKTDLQRHIDEKRLPYTSDAFDFSLDDTLKKLRQIWKQYIVKPRLKPGEKMSPLVPAKKGKKKIDVVTPISPLASPHLSSLSNLQSTTQSTHSYNSSSPISDMSPNAEYIDPRQVTTIDAFSDNASGERNGSVESIEHSLAIKRQEREAELIATKLGVVSETGQGIRCSIRSCGKLFRKEKLLRQHVKHYHPKEYKAVISSSKMYLDHENDLLGEMKPPLNLEGRKRKFSHQSYDLSQENGKRQKRNSVGMLSMHSADEDDLEIDSPSPMSHHQPTIASSSRKRNDSMISACSGVSDGDIFESLTWQNGAWNSANMPKPKTRVIPPPSTPPTFRFSKRRQAQLRANRRNDSRTSPREASEAGLRLVKTLEESSLSTSMSPKVALKILDESMLTSPTLRLADQHQITPIGASSQCGGTSVGLNLPGQSSYPPSEMDVVSVTGSEHLTTEELVNCSCRRLEEDGLMIQCDICLCWQHGSCLGIEEEDQVPEYYVCETCRNPRLGRTSAKYSVDQDWLNKGILPVAIDSSLMGEAAKNENLAILPNLPRDSREQLVENETAFRKLSELMADLANLSKLLHSLRVKLHVASQSNNSKVFMWSSPWDPPAHSIAQTQKQEEQPSDCKSQLLLSAGVMMPSVGESDVNLSQDVIAANLSFIESTSSSSLSTSLPQTLEPLPQNAKLNMKTAASSFDFTNDTTLLHRNNFHQKTKAVSDYYKHQAISNNANNLDIALDSSHTEQKTSSSYASKEAKNTLQPAPHAPKVSTMDKYIEPQETLPPTLAIKNDTDPHALDGNRIDSKSSNTPIAANPVEQLTKYSEDVSPIPSRNFITESNTPKEETEIEKSDFKIPSVTGTQTNGLSLKDLASESTTETSKSLQSKLDSIDTCSEILVNGNANDYYHSDDNSVPIDSKKKVSMLDNWDNKENQSKTVQPTMNGENHLIAEKNSLLTNCSKLSKDIAIAMEYKTKEYNTGIESQQERVSEISEPKINGVNVNNGDSNDAKEIDSATNLASGNCLGEDSNISTSLETSNNELTTNQLDFREHAETHVKALDVSNFVQTESQQQDILDVNQEVDPSMIPSLSEVQELLPSIMSSLEQQILSEQQQVPTQHTLDESSSCMNQLSSEMNSIPSVEVGCRPLQQFHAQIIPAPVIFPETKRIDKDECRLNLLHHIDAVQSEFDQRLCLVEKTLVEMESIRSKESVIQNSSNDTDEESDPAAKTKAILTLLLNDLKTSKNLVSLV